MKIKACSDLPNRDKLWLGNLMNTVVLAVTSSNIDMKAFVLTTPLEITQ